MLDKLKLNIGLDLQKPKQSASTVVGGGADQSVIDNLNAKVDE
jgi:hypothetical protein